MPLPRRLGYLFIASLCFVVIVFFLLRTINISEFLKNMRSELFIIDLTREKGLEPIQSRATIGATPTDSLPIAFFNSSDPKWTPAKAEIVENPHLLSNHIHTINEAQYIHNVDIFGKTPPLYIFIIQIHQRFTHLFHLIESLRQVRGIEEAIVVFSHDFFSPEANRMIDDIRFVRFLQIFFPYTRQLFPDSFPGRDPRDCRAPGEKNCLNSEWPDIAGNYRDSRFAQVKHHWIWKLCFVMNKMLISKSFSGHYILLEEDYIVLKDIFHVLNLTTHLNSNFDIIALGSYEDIQRYNSLETVLKTHWVSSKHNMGMAFRKSLFEKLKPCWEKFCVYDDYNWDWSLSYIDNRCAKEKLQVLHFKNCGRVFHTGSCGLHSKSRECDNVEASVADVMQRVAKGGSENGGSLFPEALRVEAGPARRMLARPNGGWGDPRDHALCLAILGDRWLPLIQLPPSVPDHRRLDILEPLIPGVSNFTPTVL